MKYVVIEYLNPVLDDCLAHPSGISVMWDGGDEYPVTSRIISCPYNSREEAYKRLKCIYAERKAMLEKIVENTPYEIGDAYMSTLFIDEFDINDMPIGNCDPSTWIIKMEVVGVPESQGELEEK